MRFYSKEGNSSSGNYYLVCHSWYGFFKSTPIEKPTCLEVPSEFLSISRGSKTWRYLMSVHIAVAGLSCTKWRLVVLIHIGSACGYVNLVSCPDPRKRGMCGRYLYNYCTCPRLVHVYCGSPCSYIADSRNQTTNYGACSVGNALVHVSTREMIQKGTATVNCREPKWGQRRGILRHIMPNF